MSEAFWCAVPRDAARVTGPDALSYLQSQLSQDLGSLAVGTSMWSLLLQPTGKVDALVRVRRTDEEELTVDVDAGWGDAVLARLRRFMIRVKASVEPFDLPVVAVRGGLALPEGAVPAWWGPECGFDLLGPSEPPASLQGVAAADEVSFDAARVAAGWPAMGREITEQTIPAELGPLLDLAVSFTKGCYPGQELVERMDSRGASAPRLLRRLEAAAELTAGAVITANGREVGRVTSAAGGQALGLVGRTVEPGSEVTVAGTPASVLALR